MPVPQPTDQDLSRVRARLRAATGIELGPSKDQMVVTRLRPRVEALGLRDFAAYLDALDADGAGDEAQEFINALTTNKTSFFREPWHFKHLAKTLRARADRAPVRVWCAASSTGEEPWSIAMTAARALGDRPERVRVLASDIDTEVLRRARLAVYSAACLDDIPAVFHPWLVSGTGAQEGNVRVRAALRDVVTFGKVNLREAFKVRGGLDAIFCRNALIYFQKEDQVDTVRRLAALLRPGGHLYLGHSESWVGNRAGLRSHGECVFSADAEAHAA